MSKHLLAPAVLAALVFLHSGAAGAAAPATSWPDTSWIDPGSDMQVRVLADGLPAVDNLAIGDDGVLYATLELKAPNGRVVRITQTDDGVRVETILDGLNRPDGLLFSNGSLFITEEVKKGRVIGLDLTTGKVTLIANLANPEGIDRLPDGSLIASEDIPDGRVVQISPTGKITTLAAGLNRPEGLAVDGAGNIFVAETGTGRILKIADGKTSVAFSGLKEPDQVEVGPYGAVWVTEDATPGRLLKGFLGRLYPVLQNLSAPQGIAFSLGHGHCGPKIYIAEQGQSRILEASSPCGSTRGEDP